MKLGKASKRDNKAYQEFREDLRLAGWPALRAVIGSWRGAWAGKVRTTMTS